MTNNIQDFKIKLRRSTGLTNSAIEAAWPSWWSDEADHSPSAQAELKFSLARKLGLDPRSLLQDNEPTFIWDDSAKYKNFRGNSETEKAAITSFGVMLSRILIKAKTSKSLNVIENISALALREIIIKSQNNVNLLSLMSLLWGVGIPVIHMRVHPLSAKRMSAMAVRIEQDYAILLAQDSLYPASLTFHLAHEIGHIALGHLKNTTAIVDMEESIIKGSENDSEELEADCFALALLTGYENFSVDNQGTGSSAKQLAVQATEFGEGYHIEPGIIALCYGHSTGDWAVANKSLRYIYSEESPVWKFVNKIAKKELNLDLLDDDTYSYLTAIMGGVI